MGMEPPNYQPQPARFEEKSENCRLSETDGKVTRCKKFEQTVRHYWVCDDWEPDGSRE